jgi:hypothetical protein
VDPQAAFFLSCAAQLVSGENITMLDAIQSQIANLECSKKAKNKKVDGRRRDEILKQKSAHDVTISE